MKVNKIVIKNWQEQIQCIVLAESIDWIFAKNLFDYAVDGYTLLHKKFIRERIYSDKEKFTEKVLDANKKLNCSFEYSMPLVTDDLFSYLQREQIVIQISFKDESYVYVGKIEKTLPHSLYLRTISTKGIWEDTKEFIRFNSIRKIDFDWAKRLSLRPSRSEAPASHTKRSFVFRATEVEPLPNAWARLKLRYSKQGKCVLSRSPHWDMHHYFEGTELKRSPESEANYRKEWKEIIDYLHSYPSIAVWVPFNEAWGQFKTAEIAEWTKSYDSSRLVNPASGGNFYHTGDILDLHNYPGPKMYLYDAERVTVLGEYGGIGLPLQGHLWQTDKNWGYIQFQNSKEVTDEYIQYADQLKKFIQRGFSAAVYTQTTDVEGEVNGLITYDRKVIKVDEKRIREKNKEVISFHRSF